MRGTPAWETYMNVQANQRIEEWKHRPLLNLILSISHKTCITNNWDSLPAQYSVEGESAGSVTRTIHAVDELHQVVPHLHYYLYAQERPVGIYCTVSIVDTNNTKPLYKVGKVTRAALNNEPCLLNFIVPQWHAGSEGPAKIYFSHDDNEYYYYYAVGSLKNYAMFMWPSDEWYIN